MLNPNPKAPHRARRWLVLAQQMSIVLIGLLIGATASAKTTCSDYVAPELRKNVEALTLAGVACFEAKQYGRALRHYRQAFTYSRTPLLEAAIGRSMHELGMWSAARAYYRRFLSSKAAEQDPAGARRIKERLNALQKQLKNKGSLVTFRAKPTRTYVYLDLPNGHRESLGATPMSMKLAPGDYTLIFERRGYHANQTELDLSPKEKQVVEVELVPQNAPFNITARTYKQVGATTIAVGIPLLAAGGILWSLGANKIDEAETLIGTRPDEAVPADDRKLLESGSSQAAWGQGLFILGGAAIVTGVVLTITGYSQEDDGASALKKKKKKAGLQPILSPTQVGVIWNW